MKTKLDHFGFVAPYYDRIFNDHNIERLTNLFHLHDGALVLDAGGGTGRISQGFQRGICRVVTADQSFKMVRIAKEKEGLLPICTSTETLAFAGNLFNAIIIVDALHHVEDAAQTAAELWRVLKPGGRLVIEEPNIDHFGVKLLALAEKLALMRSHFIAPQKMVALFAPFLAECQVKKDGAITWIIVDKPLA